MTEQDQMSALAELDGWIHHYDTIHGDYSDWQVDGWHRDGSDDIRLLPPYLTSRDAIIPVIEKCIIAGLIPYSTEWIINFNILMTAKQICEALLRATGKWKD